MSDDQPKKSNGKSPISERSRNAQKSIFKKIHTNVFEKLFPGKQMTQVRTCRDSISLLDSSIFETSHAEKLVQYIRQKRGKRNAQRIFCNTQHNNDERNISFPIEIVPSQENGKKDNPINNEENNSCQIPTESLNSNRQLNTPPPSGSKIPKVSMKRISAGSGNLVKRVLTKEFEKTIVTENPFRPIASSTPNSGIAVANPDISGISVISPPNDDNQVALPHLRTSQIINDCRNIRSNINVEEVIRKEGKISDTNNTRSENPSHQAQNNTRNTDCTSGRNNFDEVEIKTECILINSSIECDSNTKNVPSEKSIHIKEQIILETPAVERLALSPESEISINEIDQPNEILGTKNVPSEISKDIKEEIIPETPAAERLALSPESEIRINEIDQPNEIPGLVANTNPREVANQNTPCQQSKNYQVCGDPVKTNESQNVHQSSHKINQDNSQQINASRPCDGNNVISSRNLSQVQISNNSRKELHANKSNRQSHLSPMSTKRCYISLRRKSVEKEKTGHGVIGLNRENRSVVENARIERNTMMPSSPRIEIESRRKSNRCEVLIRTETSQCDANKNHDELHPNNNTVQQIRRDFSEHPLVVIPINQSFRKTNDEGQGSCVSTHCNKCFNTEQEKRIDKSLNCFKCFNTEEENRAKKITNCNKCSNTQEEKRINKSCNCNTGLTNKPQNQKEKQRKATKRNNKLLVTNNNDDIMTSDEEYIMRYSVSEDENVEQQDAQDKQNDNPIKHTPSKSRSRNITSTYTSGLERRNTRINSNQPIDLRVRRSNTARQKRSGCERNLRTVHPSDELIDEIMLPLQQDILNPSSNPESARSNKPPTPDAISNSSSSSNETLEAFNDNLTEWHPLTRNEIVLDMPAQSTVPAWANTINSLSQNRVNRRAARTKGRRVIAKIDSLKETYMNISKKASGSIHKQSNSFRRKLYSKGQSDNDDNETITGSQQDEDNGILPETPVSTDHAQKVVGKSLNSKNSKTRKEGGRLDNFSSIDKTLNIWNNHEKSEHLEKKSSTIVSEKTDDELFKKPIHPPLKSTTKKKGLEISETRVKLKHSLQRNRTSIRRDSSHSSSSSSRSNSSVSDRDQGITAPSRLKKYQKIKNKTSDKTTSTTTISGSKNNQTAVDVPVEPELMNESDTEITEIYATNNDKIQTLSNLTNPRLSVIRESKQPRRNSAENENIVETPVESINSNGVENKKKRKYNKKKKQKDIDANDSLEKGEENSLPKKKPKNTENKLKAGRNGKIEEEVTSDIRRSSRQRRGPIAYWTNNGRNLEPVEIIYKEPSMTELYKVIQLQRRKQASSKVEGKNRKGRPKNGNQPDKDGKADSNKDPPIREDETFPKKGIQTANENAEVSVKYPRGRPRKGNQTYKEGNADSNKDLPIREDATFSGKGIQTADENAEVSVKNPKKGNQADKEGKADSNKDPPIREDETFSEEVIQTVNENEHNVMKNKEECNNNRGRSRKKSNLENREVETTIITSAGEATAIAAPIMDHPVLENAIFQEESHVANDLFDRLKESFCKDAPKKRKNYVNSSDYNKLYKNLKLSEETLTEKRNSRTNRSGPSSRPPIATASSDDGICVSDENNQTIPPQAQITANVANLMTGNQQDGLLTWLKTFLTTRPMSKNKEIVQILRSDSVKIANVEDLVCTEIKGVEYAYYLGEDNNYGYMKFYPNSVKPKSKTKKFHLKFLILCGTLHLDIDNTSYVVKNGDFLSVEKGRFYKLSNTSPDPALLFFIKVI